MPFTFPSQHFHIHRWFSILPEATIPSTIIPSHLQTNKHQPSPETLLLLYLSPFVRPDGPHHYIGCRAI